jgi:nucleoside 2-deoxyribosyltransferase/SAM-dependent methyltransferase
MRDVYIANAMFGDADRAFNATLAAKLRASGLTVFLPQETGENRAKAPSAQEIFVSDTRAIATCRVVLGVLDQETIDCGVASEIGLAFAAGTPVIGLLTDFRQFREGPGRIYKNPYVIGMIERNGRVCHSLDEAVAACKDYLAAAQPAQMDQRVRKLYAEGRPQFTALLRELETWYEPSFDPAAEVVECLAGMEVRKVLDIGCGDGRLGDAIAHRWPGAAYVGVDPAWHGVSTLVTHADLASVSEQDFDVAVMAFVLHDVWDRDSLFERLLPKMRHGGRIVILDLSQDDLPRLVGALRDALWLGPPGRDPRLRPAQISALALRHRLSIATCRVIHRRFSFPDRQRFIAYAGTFGLARGLDLPLLPFPGWSGSLSPDDLADAITFPHSDDRWFLKCLLTIP